MCLSIFPSQSVVSKHTEAHSKFKLSNVTEKDAGKYCCRASNFVGKSENAFWLKIHKPGKSPSFKRQPPSSHLMLCFVSTLSAGLLLVAGWLAYWLANGTNAHTHNTHTHTHNYCYLVVIIYSNTKCLCLPSRSIKTQYHTFNYCNDFKSIVLYDLYTQTYKHTYK